MNQKKTSKKIQSLAAKTLIDSNSSTTAKKLAGSALSQTNKKNQTGSDMESLASTVLTSNKYSDDTKALAASVLAQSNKNR